MMSNWQTLKLGDVTKWSSGGTPKKTEASYWNGDIPWISASSMDGHLYTDSKLKITEEGLANGSRLAPKNSILVLVRGSILHQKMQVGITTRPVAFNQDVKCLVADEEYLDPWYLLLWFKAKERELLTIVESTGIGAGKFDTKLLSEYPIKVPPKEEREKIKKLGKALFDKSINLFQTNQTLEQMAQALFKSWFVDFDPVIDNALDAGNSIPEELQAKAEQRKAVIADGNFKSVPDDIRQLFPSEFEESELGWVPKGWLAVSIHDLVDSISDTYKLKDVNEVIFLNTGDIENGKFLHNNYSATDGLPGQAKKSISNGDILYSEIRPKNKRFAFVNFDAQDYVVSTKLMVLRARKGVNPILPYFILTQEKTVNELQHVAEHRSGTFPQITFKELKKVISILPQEQELLDYFVNHYLTPFFAKALDSMEQSEQLGKIRDTLLPKLISGEFSIPELKIEV
ncbi:restriction endonuclease subunit S [Aliikangiella marina]|uniref:Restriction endonuclease subunit S n=1 Tax=Aliikangiella marina TaxID=1712262 RepID=A0A545T2G6_9GAMM|nr:restriction endonuclease subunit S [Aliikangiella marina]TQV71408.1 restriction endonuclease subunit S [Aliikangiella marina]